MKILIKENFEHNGKEFKRGFALPKDALADKDIKTFLERGLLEEETQTPELPKEEPKKKSKEKDS